jgi:sugar lactone lactonase YvrE
VLTRRSRTLTVLAVTALAVTLAAPPGQAAPAARRTWLPATIALPDGFQPEGIAIGALPFAFFGSRADGSIYRASLISGRGAVISPGPGTPSLGMKLDARGRLFVAGGVGGDARVVDGLSGRVLASYPLQDVPSFINDVVLTRDAAWFTDSANPVLFRLPLDRPALEGSVRGRSVLGRPARRTDGGLPRPTQIERLPLTGAIVYATGTNANGITATPDGSGLLIVQSNTGLLFRVDPDTGVTTTVDLGGQSLPAGDGMLLRGNILYVVQNRLNTVVKLRLDADGTRGEVLTRVTDPRFDVPTTIAGYGPRLYLPNARFSTPPTPDTPYTAVAITAP